VFIPSTCPYPQLFFLVLHNFLQLFNHLTYSIVSFLSLCANAYDRHFQSLTLLLSCMRFRLSSRVGVAMIYRAWNAPVTTELILSLVAAVTCRSFQLFNDRSVSSTLHIDHQRSSFRSFHRRNLHRDEPAGCSGRPTGSWSCVHTDDAIAMQVDSVARLRVAACLVKEDSSQWEVMTNWHRVVVNNKACNGVTIRYDTRRHDTVD